ncbi:MAG TPA: hypothetical protein VGR81_14200 [Candidatus Acidoferrales bacterium]|nr:hypothetical protein [Candidatus Acidoferrales bacterium]
MNFAKIIRQSFLAVACGSLFAMGGLVQQANAAPRYDTYRNFPNDRRDLRQDLRERRTMNRDVRRDFRQLRRSNRRFGARSPESRAIRRDMRRDFRQRYAMNRDIRQDRRELWRDRRGR